MEKARMFCARSGKVEIGEETGMVSALRVAVLQAGTQGRRQAASRVTHRGAARVPSGNVMGGGRTDFAYVKGFRKRTFTIVSL